MSKTENAKSPKADKPEPTLRYVVAKAPPATGYLQVGKVRAYPGGIVNLTKSQAEAIDAASPGCLNFLGV